MEAKRQPSNSDPIETPKWLNDLQQKSWEPEILLSGIVLYGMFQVPGLLEEFLRFAKTNIYGNGQDIDNMFAVLKVATYWLISGLILHLVSRGIWVGMVGLSFTFPQGINVDNLKLSPKFKEHIEKIPSIQDIIISLEKVCSSLFSLSFMLFMSMVGGYFFFLVLLVTPLLSYVFILNDGNFDTTDQIVMTSYVFIVFGITIIGLIDFLLLGALKRIKWLAKFYWPIYKLVGFLTFSKFYRPIYYSIVSNFSKWKISVFLFLFFVITIFGIRESVSNTYYGDSVSRISLWSDLGGVNAYSGNYDDQNDEHFSLRASIQSDVISGNTVRLFVVSLINIEDNIKELCNYDSLRAASDLPSGELKLDCISQYYHIYIDDEIVENNDWRFHFKVESNQRGILTWIDISELDQGLHTLDVKGPLNEESQSHYSSIPFYREQLSNGNLQLPRYPAKEEMEDEDGNYYQVKPGVIRQ